MEETVMGSEELLKSPYVAITKIEQDNETKFSTDQIYFVTEDRKNNYIFDEDRTLLLSVSKVTKNSEIDADVVPLPTINLPQAIINGTKEHTSLPEKPKQLKTSKRVNNNMSEVKKPKNHQTNLPRTETIKKDMKKHKTKPKTNILSDNIENTLQESESCQEKLSLDVDTGIRRSVRRKPNLKYLNEEFVCFDYFPKHDKTYLNYLNKIKDEHMLSDDEQMETESLNNIKPEKEKDFNDCTSPTKINSPSVSPSKKKQCKLNDVTPTKKSNTNLTPLNEEVNILSGTTTQENEIMNNVLQISDENEILNETQTDSDNDLEDLPTMIQFFTNFEEECGRKYLNFAESEDRFSFPFDTVKLFFKGFAPCLKCLKKYKYIRKRVFGLWHDHQYQRKLPFGKNDFKDVVREKHKCSHCYKSSKKVYNYQAIMNIIDLLTEEKNCSTKPESTKMTFKSIEKQSDKIFMYTGLVDADMFYSLLNLLNKEEVNMNTSEKKISVLIPADELLLTLMKLRLNLTWLDLSVRFDVTEDKLLDIFMYWMKRLSHVLVKTIMPTIPKRLSTIFNSTCMCCNVFIKCVKITIADQQKNALLGVMNGFITYCSDVFDNLQFDHAMNQCKSEISKLFKGCVILVNDNNQDNCLLSNLQLPNSCLAKVSKNNTNWKVVDNMLVRLTHDYVILNSIPKQRTDIDLDSCIWQVC